MEAAEQGSKSARDGEAKKERSTGHKPEECPVCMIVFDDKVQRPRTLPCGHTVCTLCVNKLKQHGYVACPECRVNHTMPEGGQFPISYIVEAFIREKEGAEAAAAASPPPSPGIGKGAAAAAGLKQAAGFPREMQSFLQEEEASIVATIIACRKVQAQLDQYKTTLRGWGEQQQQLEDRLQGLLDQSRSARELVRQEESRAAAKKEEAREGERQLHAALEALRTPAADKEAGVAVVEFFRCTGEVEQVLKECRKRFPDANTTATVRKVRAASNAALEAFQAALEAHHSVPGEEPLHHSEADSTIEDRLQATLTPIVCPIVVYSKSGSISLKYTTHSTVFLARHGHLHGPHLRHVQWTARPSVTNWIATLVFLRTGRGPPQPNTACQEAAGGWTRVWRPPGGGAAQTCKNKPGGPPGVPPYPQGGAPATRCPDPAGEPAGAALPPCEVFLDLSWPGSAPRRVRVRLSPDTPLGRQAVLLCTGQRGPSYAGTRLFKVVFKGQPEEYVCGGDYESNDGSGGAALLPGLYKSEYRQSRKAGAVFGWSNSDARGAGFCIRTRDGGGVFSYIFGEVVQGLDAVLGAARHPPITEVLIKDSGVLLWE